MMKNDEFNAMLAKLDAALNSGNWERICAAGFLLASEVKAGNGVDREREVLRRHNKYVELARVARMEG